MKLTVNYNNNAFKKFDDEPKHKKLIEEGWKVISIEESKERDVTKTCLLGCLFLPLALLGTRDTLKVTYEKKDNE